jgi:uncharacterized protein
MTFKPLHALRALGCLLLVLAGPAVAQEYEASHLQAARRTIEAVRADEQFDQILPVLAEQAKALFLRANPSLVQEVDEVVNQVALQLASLRPQLDRELERVWAARFTEEQLNEITAFYSSEVGTALGEGMDGIIQDSLRAANIWRDALSTEIVTRSREELIARGHQF